MKPHEVGGSIASDAHDQIFGDVESEGVDALRQETQQSVRDFEPLQSVVNPAPAEAESSSLVMSVPLASPDERLMPPSDAPRVMAEEPLWLGDDVNLTQAGDPSLRQFSEPVMAHPELQSLPAKVETYFLE